jgi:hypothetical protein
MNEPTVAQFKRLYLLSYTLTNVMFQPIHIIRIDERNNNLFILAGHQENIEIIISPNGEVFSWKKLIIKL